MSPVILHHGLIGTRSYDNIGRSLKKMGVPVFVSSVHPKAAIETRARQLREWILSLSSRLLGRKAIIVAHSMGGLDCRFMLAKLGMASHVAAVATVSTPHRGSPYADWCAQHVGTKLRGFEVVRRLGLDVRGIRDLTTESCARFNEEIRDVPGVRYFSISTGRRWREIPAFGLPSWYVIHRVEGLNDGLVSVQSAKWAKHLASWNLDHWHAVNQRYGLVAIKEGDISLKYLDLIRKIDGEIDGEIAAN